MNRFVDTLQLNTGIQKLSTRFSELILVISDSKTYTVFAPTDAAFARLSPVELSKYSDKAAARALVAKHVLPGTLYSAGMRYYQLRNSMEDAKPLTLQKSSGKLLKFYS